MPTKNTVDLSELFYKQRGRCYWCDRTMVLGGNDELSATREHLVPQAHGGRNFVRRAALLEAPGALCAEVDRLRAALASEREACAKVCDAVYDKHDTVVRELFCKAGEGEACAARDAADECANAIRTRKEDSNA